MTLTDLFLFVVIAGIAFATWQLRQLRRIHDAQNEALAEILGRLVCLKADTCAGYDSQEFALVSDAGKAALLDAPGNTTNARWN